MTGEPVDWAGVVAADGVFMLRGSPPWRLRVPGFDRLRVNDSDEHGVPSNADTAWRQSTLQRWVRLAIDLDGQRIDLLVTGQSPLGDLLAVPEATQVDIAVCLLDVTTRPVSRRRSPRQIT